MCDQRSQHLRSIILDILIGLLLFVIIVACLVAFVFAIGVLCLCWMVRDPFEVESFSVTNLNVSSSEISGRWEITLLARHPYHRWSLCGKMLNYKDIEVFTAYKGMHIGREIVNGFSVSVNGEARMNISIEPCRWRVFGWVADSIKELAHSPSRSSRDHMFSMLIIADSNYVIVPGSRDVFYCNGLEIEFGSNSTKSGEMKRRSVGCYLTQIP